MFLEGLAFFKTVLCTLTFIIPLWKRKKKGKQRQLEKKWLHSKSLFFSGSLPARVTFGNKTLLFLIRAWSKTNNASILFLNYYSVGKKSLPCLSTGCLPLDIRRWFHVKPLADTHLQPDVLMNIKHWPHVKKALMVFASFKPLSACCVQVVSTSSSTSSVTLNAAYFPSLYILYCTWRGTSTPSRWLLGKRLYVRGEWDRGRESKRERSVAPIKASDWYNWVISALRERHLLALS